MDIAGRRVGRGQPCLVIAEAGVNHNGDINLALKLIEAASAAGADAVKFQSFKTDKLVTADAPKALYQQRTTGASETQHQMLTRLELSSEAHRTLIAACAERNIQFLSSPFDEESADLLEKLNVAAFKVSSGELTNLPFLSHLARKRKPLILSTGMSCLGEVEKAVRTVISSGADQVALLQCVSNYPANPRDTNLRAMQTMAAAFALPVGYSDHTLGVEVSLAAVALGACIVEKHFTLDRSLPGPDHQASSEPTELAALVQGIRKVEAALGTGCKEPALSEANTAAVARKSLVVSRDIPAGTVLTEEMIVIRRPGTGLAPDLCSFVVGRTARRAISAGTLLQLDMLS